MYLCWNAQLLKVDMFVKEFSNSIGIAAGFDKDGKSDPGAESYWFWIHWSRICNT